MEILHKRDHARVSFLDFFPEMLGVDLVCVFVVVTAPDPFESDSLEGKVESSDSTESACESDFVNIIHLSVLFAYSRSG